MRPSRCSSHPPYAIAAALLVALPATTHAQLLLRDALREADRAAYANRAAAGNAAAAHAATLAPLEGIVPRARLEAGVVRTTDPIGAFGTTLRQRGVTPAAFDPERLNYPAPTRNHQSAVVAEVPVFNPDAWAARSGARHAAAAADAQATWTQVNTRTAVIRAYYGAALAAVRVTTLESAAQAAAAHLAQAESMVREGLVTRADALLASVRAGEVRVQLAEARGHAITVQRELAVVIGRSGDELPALVNTLPHSSTIRRVTGADTTEQPIATRGDLVAAGAAQQAAQANATRARNTLLPRINSFARYDWNAPAQLVGGSRNWSVGVLASWNLLPGAAERSDLRAARARADEERAHAEGAEARAALEVEASRITLVVALQRLDIAELGAMQSHEAQRLVERRYAGGLATVAELLGAHATATERALALADARFSTIAAAAARRQALGLDPGALVALENDQSSLASPPSPSRFDPSSR